MWSYTSNDHGTGSQNHSNAGWGSSPPSNPGSGHQTGNHHGGGPPFGQPSYGRGQPSWTVPSASQGHGPSGSHTPSPFYGQPGRGRGQSSSPNSGSTYASGSGQSGGNYSSSPQYSQSGRGRGLPASSHQQPAGYNSHNTGPSAPTSVGRGQGWGNNASSSSWGGSSSASGSGRGRGTSFGNNNSNPGHNGPIRQPQPPNSTIDWLATARMVDAVVKVPTRTHTSSMAVSGMLDKKDTWPQMLHVPAERLSARAFTVNVTEPNGNTTVQPAMLAEALPHIIKSLSTNVPFRQEHCSMSNEADVVASSLRNTYNNLLTLIRRDIHDARHGTVVDTNSGFTVHKLGDGRSTYSDHAFVLKNLNNRDIKDPASEWFRCDNLEMGKDNPSFKDAVKCVLLMLEFKKLHTNTTARKAGTTEWSFDYHPGGFAFIPQGTKTEIVFAQALIYAQTHQTETIIIDDWTGPVLLRFQFRDQSGFTCAKRASSQDPRPFPYRGSVSLLLGAADYQDGDKRRSVMVQAAALFILADNLCKVGCSSIPTRVPALPNRNFFGLDLTPFINT